MLNTIRHSIDVMSIGLGLSVNGLNAGRLYSVMFYFAEFQK